MIPISTSFEAGSPHSLSTLNQCRQELQRQLRLAERQGKIEKVWQLLREIRSCDAARMAAVR